MLQTENLSFKYTPTSKFDFPNIDVKANEVLLILGESGKGKTTLLHNLAGILSPDSGSVTINGQSLYKLSNAKKDAFRGQHVSIIFQKPHFINAVSAIENLILTQSFGKNRVSKNEAQSILDRLEIGHRANAKISEMSQGELQRLSIARAVINKPKVILADEPTSALDDKNCNIVIDLLQETANTCNAALIIVTHDNRLKDIITNQVTI